MHLARWPTLASKTPEPTPDMSLQIADLGGELANEKTQTPWQVVASGASALLYGTTYATRDHIPASILILENLIAKEEAEASVVMVVAEEEEVAVVGVIVAVKVVEEGKEAMVVRAVEVVVAEEEAVAKEVEVVMAAMEEAEAEAAVAAMEAEVIRKQAIEIFRNPSSASKNMEPTPDAPPEISVPANKQTSVLVITSGESGRWVRGNPAQVEKARSLGALLYGKLYVNADGETESILFLEIYSKARYKEAIRFVITLADTTPFREVTLSADLKEEQRLKREKQMQKWWWRWWFKLQK
ncbi:hypothetical protein BDP27DRAFT_1400059 [Rhodocollybia butyracea]|uniref:Uncharacterized protein n=1 Tax=Rhodocollybia butyracea TaxID=206335 RepID=A0A9P5UC73_9AGAR|nr:hypothetical protein BDP27DRAFT_1400059 [Rhodocollybia butyracea]